MTDKTQEINELQKKRNEIHSGLKSGLSEAEETAILLQLMEIDQQILKLRGRYGRK